MKVTFKTATLRYLLRVTCRTVGKDGASITSHVMLTAAGETLTAMTTDNIAGTSIVATAQVAEDGAICLPGKKLQEIVTKLPEYGDATITADTERWKATITCGNYRGTISGMDPTFMPRSATMEDLDEGQEPDHQDPDQGPGPDDQAGRHLRPGREALPGHQPHRCAGDLQQQRRDDDELRRRASLRAHHPGHRRRCPTARCS